MSGSPPPGSGPASGAEPRISILVPAYDEAENMPELFSELAATLAGHHLSAEVVLIDDGSRDGTLEAGREAAARAELSGTTFLRHRHNRGKTAALVTGARAARGDIFVLFDADLQHAPEEIPRLVAELDRGYDMVVGRKVGRYEKRFVSGIYNWLARRIFGVPVHDLNALKAFRREVLEEVRLRSDWHRYLVVLAHARGFRVGEIDVELHPRRHGVSKYGGRGRIVVGSLDLVSVWFQLVFSRRPMLLFGVTGLVLLGAGALVGLVAVYLRVVLHAGYRPLLTLVLLLVVVGVMLFAIGFLAELIASLRGEVDDLRSRLEERR